MTYVTRDSLFLYFKDHIGPVFCQPSMDLLHRYPQMKDMLGIVLPFDDDKKSEYIVDWSIDKEYTKLSSLYPYMLKDEGTSRFLPRELNILKPGIDIPQIADERCGDYRWEPSKRGDLVVISDAMLQACSSTSSKKVYGALEPVVGVVTDRCSGDNEQLIVTFGSKNWSKIVNVPSSILVCVPDRFRQKEQVINVKTSTAKADFAMGDVVKVSASYANDNYVGLIGIVKEVILDNPAATFNAYEYLIDFDTLPNRCLALTDGEGSINVYAPQLIKEVHLDEWDEKISDKPWLSQFRSHNNRDRVWIPHANTLGNVIMKTGASKSIGTGMSVEVKILRDNGKEAKSKLSCRDLDYCWQPEALESTLGAATVCLGIEEDRRNPNEIETKAYLYVFDRPSEIGKNVSIRILLGSINKRKSLLKKFARQIQAQKIEHPWQVHRYLKKKSLGYFYQIFTASEYLDKVGKFVNA